MPMWLWWLIPVFVVHVILAFVASPPETVANWFIAKFELHPKLVDETTTISFDGSQVDEQDKRKIVEHFNKALFIDRYYDIMPQSTGQPIVIETQIGKVYARFFVYVYSDHVDVFRQVKKKIIAYRLLSDSLQEYSFVSGVACV